MATYADLISNKDLALILDCDADRKDRDKQLADGSYWDDVHNYYYDPVPSDWYFEDDDEDYEDDEDGFYHLCEICGGKTGDGWNTCLCDDDNDDDLRP